MRTIANRRRIASAAGMTMLCAVMARSAGQEPAQAPVFRAAVNAVEVDVRVTGRNGEAIRNLTVADFELRDNGTPQTITSVSLIDLAHAVPAAAADPVAPDAGGRVFVLVLDDLQIDPRWTTRARDLARQFVERSLAPGDRMIVRVSGGGPAIAHQFTSDKALLFRVIDSFTGRKLASAAVEESDRRAVRQELRTWTSTSDPFARERALNARASLVTLREAANSLGEVRGRRKAIVLISEGIDYDITDAVGTPGEVTDADSIGHEIREAVAAAARTNTSIYPIDPRGLSQNTADTISAGAVDRQASAGLRRELLMSQSSLRELAETTGGIAAVNANDLAPFFNRVVDDTTTYYLLSFSPTPSARPGSFHKVEVRVRRSGVRVRARPGYMSASASPLRADAPAVLTTAPTSSPAVETPAAGSVRADPAAPELLARVLQRVAAYVAEYQVRLAGIVAEEHYRQEVRNFTGSAPGRTSVLTPQRALRSDLLLVKPAGEDRWMQFRDVFEVDGQPIRDRDARLQQLFLQPSDGSLRQADQIQAEGARYNIGPLTRTMNVPVLALMFFDQANQSRFAFARARPGNVRSFAGLAAEADVWAIGYRETAPATLIRGAGNRDLPSRGTIWVDSTTGRILRTELMSRDTQVSAEVTVTYRTEPGVDLLVPAEMREQYLVTQSNVRIEGAATYSRFRRFTVVTTEKPQPH